MSKSLYTHFPTTAFASAMAAFFFSSVGSKSLIMRPFRGGRGERKTETNKGSEGLVADLKLLTQ